MLENIDNLFLESIGDILGRAEYGFADHREARKDGDGAISKSLYFEQAGGSSSIIFFSYHPGEQKYFVGYYDLDHNYVKFETQDKQKAIKELQKAVSDIPRYRLRDVAKSYLEAPNLEEAISGAMSVLVERKKHESICFKEHPPEMTEEESKVLSDYVTELYQKN